MKTTIESTDAGGREQGHHNLCEGHIDCPRCGPETCCRPVVTRGAEVVTVLCLRCWQPRHVQDGSYLPMPKPKGASS